MKNIRQYLMFVIVKSLIKIKRSKNINDKD